jgi:hypothetical protein
MRQLETTSALILFATLTLAGHSALAEEASPEGNGAAESTVEPSEESEGEPSGESEGESEGEPSGESEGGLSNEGDASPAEEAPPEPPAIVGLPGQHLDVSFLHAVDGLRAGGRLTPGRDLELSEGSCIRLLAGQTASVAVSGPGRLRVEERQGRLLLSIVAGRGVFAVGDEGAALQLGEALLVSRGGLATFDAAASPAVSLVSGSEAWLDGERLEAVESGAAATASALLAPDWCAPPRPALAVPLGDARSLVANVETARRDATAAEDEGATAESGATCVDSADSGSASSPTTGDGVVIDPDVRRDETGRLRLTIRVPRP